MSSRFPFPTFNTNSERYKRFCHTHSRAPSHSYNLTFLCFFFNLSAAATAAVTAYSGCRHHRCRRRRPRQSFYFTIFLSLHTRSGSVGSVVWVVFHVRCCAVAQCSWCCRCHCCCFHFFPFISFSFKLKLHLSTFEYSHRSRDVCAMCVCAIANSSACVWSNAERAKAIKKNFVRNLLTPDVSDVNGFWWWLSRADIFDLINYGNSVIDLHSKWKPNLLRLFDWIPKINSTRENVFGWNEIV